MPKPLLNHPTQSLVVYYQLWETPRFFIIEDGERVPFPSLATARNYASANGYNGIKVKAITEVLRRARLA